MTRYQMSFFALLIFLGACGPTLDPQDKIGDPIPHLKPTMDQDALCTTLSPATGQPVALKMLLTETVTLDNAPFAENDAERFVFKQVFETLTRVDCDGNLQPGLASDWQSSYGGKRWTFTLRQNSKLSDGTPVTSRMVALSWLHAARLDLRQTAPSPFQWLDVINPGVIILDDQHLQITVMEAMDDLPLLLAHQSLAMVYTTESSDAILGSGPCYLDPSYSIKTEILRLLPNSHHPQTPRWLNVDLIIQPGSDIRAMLEAGINFTVVRDNSLLESFSLSRKHQTINLPWDRMYLLVCPPGETDLRQRWNTDWSSRELVAKVSVTPSTSLDHLTFIEPRSSLCPLFMLPEKPMDWPLFSWPGMVAAHDNDLVLFPENDKEAEALAGFMAKHAGRSIRPAESLAGRTAMTTPRRPLGGMAPQALSIPQKDFHGALQSGRAGAYILPMNRTWFSACRQISALINMASWLQDAALDQQTTTRTIPEGARAAKPSADFDVPAAQKIATRLRRGRTVLPLTMSRACVVADKSMTGFKTDWDGILDITNVMP